MRHVARQHGLSRLSPRHALACLVEHPASCSNRAMNLTLASDLPNSPRSPAASSGLTCAPTSSLFRMTATGYPTRHAGARHNSEGNGGTSAQIQRRRTMCQILRFNKLSTCVEAQWFRFLDPSSLAATHRYHTDHRYTDTTQKREWEREARSIKVVRSSWFST